MCMYELRNVELCNFSDSTYEVSVLVLAFETGIAHYEDKAYVNSLKLYFLFT
jgi:hypothetical protein